MLGVGLSELGLVFVVALIVLGPTRMPGLVRKIGRWVGKARTMARDFQQQLENEVNLDELNRMTNDIARQAHGTTPSPPPEAFGDSSAAPPATQPAVSAAESGYPYGVQEPAPDASTAPVAMPQPGDDTYSHAHAHGDAPMVEEPPVPTDLPAGQKKDGDVA